MRNNQQNFPGRLAKRVRRPSNWRQGGGAREQGSWIQLVLPLLLGFLLSCQHSAPVSSQRKSPGSKDPNAEATAAEAKSAADNSAETQAAAASTAASKPAAKGATTKKAESKPKVKKPPSGQMAVSPTYNEELNSIIDLTKRNRWEEAEARASALYALDPKDASVERVFKWVQTEGPKRREKVLEDEIREVSSRDSRFSPTIKSIITDKKSQGLPPRTELREAIEQIKASPYIPDNYGRTIQSKVSMEDFTMAKGHMVELLDKQVNVQLDNVTLENLIFNVGESAGINFVADKSIPAFQQKIAVNMKSVKLSNLLGYISRNMGVKFEVGGDLIWITDAKDTNHVAQETRLYKLKKSLVLPAAFGLSDSTKTFVTVAGQPTVASELQSFQNFVRDGAPKQPAIEVAIRNFVTTTNYHIDYERNIITAKGTEEQLKMLEEIIENFDRSVQQVLIEARFITVSEAAFLQLGVNWETGRNPLAQSPTATDYTGLGANGGLGANVGLGLQETSWGVLGRQGLSATLTALDQSGETETLSAPRITLINNLPASISDGKIQYYYEEYTVTQTILPNRSSSSLAPTGKPAKLESGVTLDVVASIGGDGKTILLALRPKVAADVVLKTFATVTDHNDLGQVTSTFDIKLPEMVEQSLSTRVAVKSGQTVVMGGVSQREQRHFVEAVPVLGRLPLIGAAFRKRTEVDSTRYLLVFVTATLLSENGEFIVSQDAK